MRSAVQFLQLLVLAAIVLVGLVYFCARIHTVSTIVIGSIFLFYAIYPIVMWLNRRLPLWASITIVYLIVLVVVAGALAYFVPQIGNNIRQLTHDIPAIIANLQSSPVLQRLPPAVRDFVLRVPSQLGAFFRGNGGAVFTNTLHTVVSIVSTAAIFIVIPIVTIYIMIDTDRIRQSFLSIVPPQSRPKTVKVLHEIHLVIGGYIRGQLLVAAIVGVLITILLTGLHVPYAAALGIFAGFLEIVPYAGAVVGGALAVLAALISNGPVNAAIVVAGLVVINQLEGHVISPLVVGESVKLRPLTIVLALLTGAELFGIIGVLVAVPIAGIIKVLVSNFLVQPE